MRSCEQCGAPLTIILGRRGPARSRWCSPRCKAAYRRACAPPPIQPTTDAQLLELLAAAAPSGPRQIGR